VVKEASDTEVRTVAHTAVGTVQPGQVIVCKPPAGQAILMIDALPHPFELSRGAFLVISSIAMV
jgi:hypothetical protein